MISKFSRYIQLPVFNLYWIDYYTDMKHISDKMTTFSFTQ